jgi:hypothetical protein
MGMITQRRGGINRHDFRNRLLPRSGFTRIFHVHSHIPDSPVPLRTSSRQEKIQELETKMTAKFNFLESRNLRDGHCVMQIYVIQYAA